jgi:hypothetical protein
VLQIGVPPGRIDILTELTALTFAEAWPGWAAPESVAPPKVVLTAIEAQTCPQARRLTATPVESMPHPERALRDA